MSRRLIILALTFLMLFTGTYIAGAAENNDYDQGNPELIPEIMYLLQMYHVSNPDQDILVDGAIDGMLDAMEDPYAEYFTPEEIMSFTDSLNGNLVGVGIELQAGEKYPYAVGVLPNTPAERGGILVGDLITAVDGDTTEGLRLNDVVMQIRGPVDTEVTLTIRRGDSEFNVVLQRADIHIPSVEYNMLPDNTGYIALNSFGSETSEEFDAAVQNLADQGMKSLIIDLRDNGGGYLNEAVQILDTFLKKGSVVVSIVDGQGDKEEIRTKKEPYISDIPMVVIVNGLSASASEIVSAALSDYELATLMGDTTFGKGLVQNILPLSTGGALKITVYKYLTPLGRDIDTEGIEPDYYILTRALQKEMAWQLLHPENKSGLVFTEGADNVVVNGQKVDDLKIEVLHKENRVYFPLRPVLEAMFYQVLWQDGLIKVVAKEREELEIDLRSGSQDQSRGAFINEGTSYIPVDLLNELDIEVRQDGNNYTINRQN